MKYRIKSLYDNIKLTFFSGTDTNTLRAEGFDRNNFVSLIVNNAGVYSAAITRKVEYVENHNIEIKGSYPFFGTKRVLETPTTSTSEEKKKLLIEYFDLTIEKQEVSYNPSDYDEMFNSLITKKFLRGYTKTGTPGYYQGYPKTYTPPTYPQVSDDDDESFDCAEYYRNKFLKKEETKVKEETTVQGSLFDDEELFDSEFVQSALDMPVMQFRLKELLLEIVTGCPIINKWVKTYEITDKTIIDALDAFKDKKFTPAVYESFVYDNIKQRFEMLIPTDYFPGSAKIDETPDFELENILIIKMIDMAGELKASDYSIALVNALKDFYSV